MKHDGCWNAYVASGKTKDARRARLAEVPAEFRDGVISHLRTIAAIRERAAIMAKWAQEDRGAPYRNEKPRAVGR